MIVVAHKEIVIAIGGKAHAGDIFAKAILLDITRRCFFLTRELFVLGGFKKQSSRLRNVHMKPLVSGLAHVLKKM